MSEQKTTEYCVACDHPIGQHFQSVDGKVRCIHHESGTTTSGVIGLPWEWHCDCVDYRSERTEQLKDEKKREEAEQQKRFDEIFASIRKHGPEHITPPV